MAEFSVVVTVKILDSTPEGYAQMIRDGVHNAIVNYAESFPAEVQVAITEDHGEEAIAELTRALGNCIGLINALRLDSRKTGESSIVKSSLATLHKYSPPPPETK